VSDPDLVLGGCGEPAWPGRMGSCNRSRSCRENMVKHDRKIGIVQTWDLSDGPLAELGNEKL
jgi:hypothetical protein